MRKMEITETDKLINKTEGVFSVYGFISILLVALVALFCRNSCAVGYNSAEGFHYSGPLFQVVVMLNFTIVVIVWWARLLWKVSSDAYSVCAKIFKNAKMDGELKENIKA